MPTLNDGVRCTSRLERAKESGVNRAGDYDRGFDVTDVSGTMPTPAAAAAD